MRKNKKPSLCPVIMVDKNTDNLTIKNDTQQVTNLTATITTSHITCTRQNGMMTVSFNIDVIADKKQALHDSDNAYIPIGYYITLNLMHKTTTKEISLPKQEQTQGVYFITLKEIQENKMFASKRRAVALPIAEYHLDKSNITIGFISQDKTIITD